MAAVAVYEEEPVLGENHPLAAMENVVCTPHIGYVTREEYESHFADLLDQLKFCATADSSCAGCDKAVSMAPILLLRIGAGCSGMPGVWHKPHRIVRIGLSQPSRVIRRRADVQ
jgi:hypothetical protein